MKCVACGSLTLWYTAVGRYYISLCKKHSYMWPELVKKYDSEIIRLEFLITGARAA